MGRSLIRESGGTGVGVGVSLAVCFCDIACGGWVEVGGKVSNIVGKGSKVAVIDGRTVPVNSGVRVWVSGLPVRLGDGDGIPGVTGVAVTLALPDVAVLVSVGVSLVSEIGIVAVEVRVGDGPAETVNVGSI